MSKWEKCVTDFLVEQDSSLIAGMAGGFESGMTLLSQQEESEQLHTDALNKSSDMFSLQDSNADETFTMDLHNFEVDDTEEIADIPPADSQDVNEEHPAESEPTQSQETTGTQSMI